MNWNEAKTACEELVLNGYSDWHLPEKHELKQLYKLHKYNLGRLTKFYWQSPYYWSSTTETSSINSSLEGVVIFGFGYELGKEDEKIELMDYVNAPLYPSRHNVRAVRTF
jgi:hypothetical protein